MQGEWEEPDWPRLTLAEADRVLRRYPQAGGAGRLLSYSPRPFSAASVVATPLGKVFVKRHARAVRDREGLLEEHRLMEFAAARTELVQEPLRNAEGDSATCEGEWTYEVHPVARGVDVYEEALSWTPFLSAGQARAAGRAMAELHLALEGYDAPARKARPLVSGFTIFAGDGPVAAMEAYLAARPELRSYAERRAWRRSFEEFLLPLYARLAPWLGRLTPLWTHNDFHASNLTWSGVGEDAEVSGIVDFGLADRTNAVHDLATTIERNVVEWLRMDDLGAELVHFDHLDGLLSGYAELRPLSYAERRALAAMVPLVHCEFALSEADYFLSILHSEEKAYLAYEGYFLGHAEWFLSGQGRRLLKHLKIWADAKSFAFRETRRCT